MFVDHSVTLPVSFAAAREGLLRLPGGGWLRHASDHAYAEGLAGMLRVGPFGDLPGAGKLVRVLMLDAVDRDGTTSLPLRWEATGVAGRLFPVLDANLSVTGIDGESSLLELHGAYRPPLAGIGEGLDRVLLHRAAVATVRSLVRSVAASITAPQDEPAPGAAAPSPPPA